MSAKRHAGFSLIDTLVALTIAALISMASFIVLSMVYHNRQQTRLLSERITDILLMKQALVASVTAAGAIVDTAAIPSTTHTNCHSTNSNQNTSLTKFFGYPSWGNTSSTGGAATLTSVPLPPVPLTITPSSVSFDWISDNSGGQELCQGTLQIVGPLLRYTIQSQNLASGVSTCTSSGQAQSEADFLVGKGWSFQPTVHTATHCLGPAFGSQTAEALVAVKASLTDGATESATTPAPVAVCLPNL